MNGTNKITSKIKVYMERVKNIKIKKEPRLIKAWSF